MPDLFATLDEQPQPQAVDHRCLACGQIHTGAHEVTLVDGTVVSNYSEAWRAECEARGILKMPKIAARQARLDSIERRRGKAAADHLRDIMLKVWNARMAKKLPA